MQINLVQTVASTGVIRARTYCELFLLSKEAAECILKHFPKGEC